MLAFHKALILHLSHFLSSLDCHEFSSRIFYMAYFGSSMGEPSLVQDARTEEGDTNKVYKIYEYQSLVLHIHYVYTRIGSRRGNDL